MKTFTNIFAIILISVSSVLATSNPTTPVTVLTTSEVNVTLEENVDFFLTAIYDTNTENFEFTTEEKISFIQIFNPDGALEFQLPVMSDKVKIGKSIFTSGEYKLGFMIEGQKDIQFTNVTIK